MTNEKRTFLPLNLQLFGGDPQDPPTDPPKTEDPPVDPPKTFTQDELDRIVADRLTRDRKKFADYDEIKTERDRLAKEDEERKKAAMTEKERLEAEKADALKKAEEAEQTRTATIESVNKRLVRSEFRLLARSDEFKIRPDALDDAHVLADLSAVKVDDEGNVIGVKEALQQLIQAKPYLVDTKTQPKEIGGGSNPEDKSDKTNEQLLKEAADKARRTGKPEDFAAYSALKRKLNA